MIAGFAHVAPSAHWRRRNGGFTAGRRRAARAGDLLLEKRGQLAEAEALYRVELKGCLQTHGAAHPFTEASRKNLKRFLRAQGRSL